MGSSIGIPLWWYLGLGESPSLGLWGLWLAMELWLGLWMGWDLWLSLGLHM